MIPSSLFGQSAKLSFHQEATMPVCWTEEGFNMTPPEPPTLSEIKTEKEHKMVPIERTVL